MNNITYLYAIKGEKDNCINLSGWFMILWELQRNNKITQILQWSRLLSN